MVRRSGVLNPLAADEKCIRGPASVGLPGGRPVWLITESGLYKLIMRSEKPQDRLIRDGDRRADATPARYPVYLRTVMVNGEPWFVAADVCRDLGYKDSSGAVAKHVKPHQKSTTLIRRGGLPNTIISEGGLNRLIMRSQLPEAEDYQDFITDTVMPSLRKHGGYIIGQVASTCHTCGRKDPCMNVVTIIEPSSERTMSSLEIAQLTGKDHSNVIRDIRRVLEDLELGETKFGGTYQDVQGKSHTCFQLPKDLTLTLCAGYSTVLRKRIIDRWLELEAEVRQPAAAPVLTIEQKLAEAYLLATSVMQTQVARIEQLETKVEEMKPVVRVAEAVFKHERSIQTRRG